ncbi:MAG: hypothetical protein K9M02_18245 [Thiohalocapsa sp.]|nr:hypothetical protein [Thiohalocapsa sp.]
MRLATALQRTARPKTTANSSTPRKRQHNDGPQALVPAVLVTALVLGTLLWGVPSQDDMRSAALPAFPAALAGDR